MQLSELEILLARAQALALKMNGQVDEAEVHLRRAIELGSQRGEEHNILDLRLDQDDYVGVYYVLLHELGHLQRIPSGKMPGERMARVLVLTLDGRFCA